MLSRSYSDGFVAFDPIDGKTYSFPPETADILAALETLIRDGHRERSALLAAVQEEAGRSEGADAATNQLREDNLLKWVELALRLHTR